ncbi:hypothetical protein MMC11_004358 [Xylographa trunciseda]|nr:hypothetical protein [Xylographa trunciseda]
MPLVTIGFSQMDTTTTLTYDTESYDFSWSVNRDEIVTLCEDNSALCDIARNVGAIVMTLQKKSPSSAPVSMGHHPSTLINDSTGIVDAYNAAVVEDKLALFSTDFGRFRKESYDYFKRLLEMKPVAVEGVILSTDYGHYASHEDFKNLPGMYMWNYDIKKKLPSFPYWLAKTYTPYAHGKPSQATEVAELPARNSFYNMKEYEIVMCTALLWERKEPLVALEELFDNKTVHSGTLEPASKSGKSDRAWISVDITTNEAMGLVIPVPPFSAKVNFELDVEDMVGEDRIIGEVRGEVSDRPTDVDFLRYARLPQKITRKMAAKFRLQAQHNTESYDRMFSAARKGRGMLPHDKLEKKHKFPRFDIVKTVLAHGPEADLQFGNKLQLWNFLAEDE